MSLKECFISKNIASMSDIYPHAVIAENILYLSGMPGLDPVTGKASTNNFEAQTRQSFQNIKTILEEAGSDLSKVIKVTIYMVSGNDFDIVNTIYKEYFPKNAPARSVPQVMPFPAGILISVECIAIR